PVAARPATTWCWSICRFFFFQAGDGIRYRNVTGVQTCALPILNSWLDLFILKTKETINEKGNYNDLSRLLLTEVHAYLEKQGIPDTHQIYQYIILDINTCALTLLNYFKE